MTEEQLEYYVQILSENIDDADNIPDEVLDQVIKYLQFKIQENENLLKQLTEEKESY